MPALERALAILELVTNSKTGLTFSQVARRLGFPKSSVHCLLLTFERNGYLKRSPASGRYFCGMKLVHMVNTAVEGFALRDRATPLLLGLLERTGLTVHMAIMEGNEPTLIAKMDRPNMHVATWVGKRIDVHCTASGKCLIAYLPEKEMERLVQTRGMLRHNENTICSINRLKAELARIREQGFGVDDEEEEIGVRCIGAPVFDSKDRAVAAISISGPSGRMDLASQQHLVISVKETAAEISRKLRDLPDLGLVAGDEPENPAAIPAG